MFHSSFSLSFYVKRSRYWQRYTCTSQRSAAADKYKWDPSEIYPDATAFSEDLAGISNALIPQLEEYRGKLNTAANIKSLLELNGEIEIALDKPWLYVQLLLDVNQDDAEAQRLFQQFASVYSEYTSASSFITPEIIALSEETLTAMINDPDLSLYKMKLENLLDQKNHVLSVEEEELLAQTGKLRDSAYSIFRNLMYSDFQYATIEDNAGQDLELTRCPGQGYSPKPRSALRKKPIGRYANWRLITNTWRRFMLPTKNDRSKLGQKL